MENPFSQINDRLSHLEQLISELAEQGKQNPTDEGSDLLTIEQAGELLRLSKATMYSKCSLKELPYMKRGKRLFFSREELLAYLKQGRRKTLDEIQAGAAGNLINKKGGQQNG
ncbi:MAG: helix-turn-helix domain-containing protein [Flavobacteriales bacterium]